VTARFGSPLASVLQGFLEFKRRRGYRYNRSEFTLRSFDRFVAARAEQDRSWKLDVVILAWLASRPGRLAVSVSQEMAVIRQFWFYVRRVHPARCRREVRWPKLPTQTSFVPHVLTEANVQTLLHLASELERPRFRRALYRALLLVLYCTGLRIGEALRLRIADVDLRRGVIFVDEFKGRARWVPFHPSLRRELERYLRARCTFSGSRPSRDAPFFLATDGDALSPKAAGYALARMYRMAGLKPAVGRIGPRPYDLRHTFAVHRLTRWYRQGVDLHARLPWLSAYLGHVNLLGTEVYLTATPELLGLAARRFHRRFVGARRR
jgi:integrase/recombinase XerD